VAIAGTRVAPSATALLAATLRADTALPATGVQLDRRIVFASQHEGNMELYLVNADGSHLTRLTNTAESEEFPTWSPDGQWIAFQAVSQEGRQSSLVKIRPDNGQLIPLTDGSNIDLIPAWSQDGQWIAFASAPDINSPTTLYKMPADGCDRTPLNPADPMTAKTFLLASSNGQHLLNTKLFSTPDGGYNDLARRMDDTFQLGWVAWSPDRQYIAYTSSRDGNAEIYVINADGSGRVRLTNNPAKDQFPAWSPDGQRIAFASGAAGHEAIYVIGADGRHPTRLTDDVGADFSAWSPDGRLLAFKGEGGKIVIMRADGSTQVTIPVMASQFAWAPK